MGHISMDCPMIYPFEEAHFIHLDTNVQTSDAYGECHQHLGDLRGLLAPECGRRRAGEAPLGNEETQQGHEGRQTNHLQIFLGKLEKLEKLEELGTQVWEKLELGTQV